MYGRVIYLASPYTHKNESVRAERYRIAAQATTLLLKDGKHCYSPIVHCHQIAIDYKLPPDFNFWMEYNYAMLSRCTMLHILPLPDWEQSKGVAAERAFALERGIPEIIDHDLLSATLKKLKWNL